MKTGGMEVLCDGCGAPIPAMHPTAQFVTLRGPVVRHKKLDFHNAGCLAAWAQERAASWPIPAYRGAAAPPQEETR